MRIILGALPLGQLRPIVPNSFGLSWIGQNPYVASSACPIWLPLPPFSFNWHKTFKKPKYRPLLSHIPNTNQNNKRSEFETHFRLYSMYMKWSYTPVIWIIPRSRHHEAMPIGFCLLLIFLVSILPSAFSSECQQFDRFCVGCVF